MQLKDHWWWRPGWRAGRHVYAAHFSFSHSPELRELAARQQKALAGVEGLDLIPPAWLHLSMQEIGFLDEIPAARAEELFEAAAQALATVPPPVVTFREAVVRTEAIYLPATPAEPVAAVRDAFRSAMAEVLGTVPAAGPFRPHVSVAYVNRDQDSGPADAALAALDPEPVTVTLHHVDFMTYHRDNRMYEWTDATRHIPIGVTL